MREPDDHSVPDAAADRLVARGFWRSLAVIAFIAAAIVGFRVLRGPKPAAPGSGAPVAAPAESPAATAEVRGVAFVDVAAAAGVDCTHESGARGAKLLPECLAGGVGLADLDADGRLDIVFTQGQPLVPAQGDAANARGGVRIYLNRSGAGGALRFERLAGDDLLAPDTFANGLAIGDLNSDALPDIFIAAVGQDRLLLSTHRRGEPPTYAAATLPAEQEWGSSAGLLDVDQDGDLDIVVANYVRWSPEIDRSVNYTLDGVGRAYGPPTGFEGAMPALLINERGGFAAMSTDAMVAGIRNPVTGAPYAKALGLAFADLDRDGRADIFVANDKTPKFLLRNEGHASDGLPRFENIAVSTGFAYDRDGNATGAMGIDFAWLGDGHPAAIAVANFANEPTSLYIDARKDGSTGTPALFDDALGEGVGAPTRRTLGFGLVFIDADLDGDDDLVQANGHLEPDISRVQPSQTYAQPAQLLVNRGRDAHPRFAEAPAASLGDLVKPAVGRALASGDLDGDGDDDLVLVDLGGRARVLLNTQSTGNHWLSCAGPLGTEVEVTATIAGRAITQRRTISPTRSYQSQCEPVARFGLGDAARATRVRARFPDGTTREWSDIAANARVSLNASLDRQN